MAALRPSPPERLMYDSVTPADIPAGSELVAGYDDGFFSGQEPYWTAAAWGKFPGRLMVHVTVRAFDNLGQVLDCENGDASPSECPGWAAARLRAGQVPTIYCSYSLWPQVIAAFRAARVQQPQYWIAAYDGEPDLGRYFGQPALAPVVAKQYANEPITGGHYDASVVASFWPGVDAAPAPPAPSPVTLGEDTLNVLTIVQPEQATAEQPFTISGPITADGRNTNWNLTAEQDTDVTVWAWNPDGSGGTSVDQKVTANAPNVHGPQPATGDGRSTFHRVGPWTFGLIIKPGGGAVTVLLHDEAN